MKIAVLYSGLVRLSKEEVLNNIRIAKLCFPTADFYFGAWKSDKQAHELDFIDKYFDEPRFRYNPINAFVRNEIINLRIAVDSKDHVKQLHYTNRLKEQLHNRTRLKKNNHQHYAHALMVKKFGNSSYDVIVRLRYDTFIDETFINDSSYFIKYCYNKKQPIGMAGVFNELKNTLSIRNYGWRKDDLLFDLLIIHRRDMFNPDHVFKLLAQHKLQYGEMGWSQVLCHPYEITSPVSYCGYVKNLTSNL